MKTYLEPRMEVELFSANIATDVLQDSNETEILGGDFSDFSFGA